MNILFIGPYRDGTGWSEAAIRTILSLNTTDANLVVRPIRYNAYKAGLPDEILQLEKKEHLSSYDVVIQNALPHNFEYYSGHKNVGMWWTETNSIFPTQWPQKMNLMDLGIIFNHQMKDAAQKSGVKTKLSLFKIPHYDPSIYDKKYPVIDLPQLDKKYVFYSIGEFNKRKNWGALLTAFHTEFDPHEDVELIIKTDRDIKPFINQLKTELKLYSNLNYYKKEIVIHDRLSQEQIYGLHQMCNCIVVPSYGEGLCFPAMDASCFGNTVIVNDLPGILEGILWGTTEYLIKGRVEPCMSMLDSFNDLYSAHDTWNSPSVMSIRQAMRDAFTQRVPKKKPKTFHNSFENAGKSLIGLLNA